MSHVNGFMLLTPSIPVRCSRCLVLFVLAASFLAASGCKSSDKSQSAPPFFRDGAAADPALQPLPGEPGASLIVRESPGPAMPTQENYLQGGVSPGTSYGTSGTYTPPDLSAHVSDTTMVYGVPPGTETNGGGSAGSIPNAYSASPNSGTSSTGYSYGSGSNGGTTGTTSPYGSGSSQPTGSGYGGSSDYGSGTNYGGSTGSGYNGSSSPYGSGSSYDGSTGYGGGSSTGTDYYRGSMSGQTTLYAPNQEALADGDYLSDDGSKYRVVNGKKYELVQYSVPRTPVLPDRISESSTTGTAYESPIIETPGYDTSTAVPMTSDYRTAIQMTNTFGRRLGQVPIPTYDAILGQQDGLSQNIVHGMVTISEPKTVTIMPAEDSAVETVPSLNYDDYSRIGSQTATATLGAGSNDLLDEEMQNSIWTAMARQDNDLLLYSEKTQEELEAKNQPKYTPLINPLGLDRYQTIISAPAQVAQPSGMMPSPATGYVYGNTMAFPNQTYFIRSDNASPCLFRSLSQTIYQAY